MASVEALKSSDCNEVKNARRAIKSQVTISTNTLTENIKRKPDDNKFDHENINRSAVQDLNKKLNTNFELMRDLSKLEILAVQMKPRDNLLKKTMST